ncbi:MAG: RHS repeat-associated core domain-containing protein, partial [Clostridiales bacterium]|nr:RHS repeat-associated core domain-containing protein [Clostridiales bacterium]
YRGYQYDMETGLYYLQSRYYNPEWGWFLNADDTAFLSASDGVLSCNLFTYCENNPINAVDHLGTAAYYPLRSPDGAWRIWVSIYHKRRAYDIFSNLHKGILSVWNLQDNMKVVCEKGHTGALAQKLYDAVIAKDRKALSKRSVEGIKFELLCHYIIYKALKDKKNLSSTERKNLNSAKTTDIGSPRKYGYDYNAQKFENKKSYCKLIENKLCVSKAGATVIYKTIKKIGII